LFYKLRSILEEKKIIKNLEIGESIASGDIIEFQASLKRNPAIETLEILYQLLEMANAFNKDTPQNGSKTAQNKNMKSEMGGMSMQIKSLVDGLKAGNTIDLTALQTGTNYKAVITVETGFLNDPLMSDIVDGQFKIIGKVIRNVDDNESIDLLRKSALSKMPPAILKQIFDALSSLGSTEGFVIPKLELEIRGPAVQVLPIAIYA